MSLCYRFNRLFPVWALSLALIAALWPQPFTQLAGYIPQLLALVMFAMGLTLSGRDFARVAASPRPVLVGIALQFTLMPLAALAVSKVLSLDLQLTTGMVLVGASAGGTASNVITWLAGGRVALSVSMTLLSTLASVLLTPLIVWLLVGASVAVDPAAMLFSILTIVCAPVLLGVAAHHWLGERSKPLEPALASLAVVMIVVIIAIVVALNAGDLLRLGPWVALAVALHNALGLVGGYGVSRLLGFDRRTARTLAIEVGMQNSGLSVTLAHQFFTATAALPGALFSIWHNISGSLLAGYWRRKSPGDGGE